MDRPPLPAAFLERAAAFMRGEVEEVAARDAATVVIVRDGVDGIETYLLRRHTKMAFAAGMYVFPGGSVDPRDFDEHIAWQGLPPPEWARRFECEEPLARALVCAAVRETFEESGVLLAGANAHTVVEDTTGPDWEADREALVSHELAMSDMLERRGLVVRADLLAPWGHWITPRFEPRRFDTRFFVAALPSGQRTRDVSTESDHVRWRSPSQALAATDRGEMLMLPPTAVTLAEVGAFATVADVMAAAQTRPITAVLPEVVPDGAEGFRLTIGSGDAP